MTALPPEFIDNIMKVNGRAGELWVKNLDGLIAYCKNKWGFELLRPYGLSFNFVAPILFKDNKEAVLKLGVTATAIGREASVLRFFAGAGFCWLIDAETEKGILLLEKLNPGAQLSSLDDDSDACRVAAKLIVQMRDCRAEYPAIYPSILQRGEELEKLRRHFKGGSGPVPTEFVENAETLFPQLVNGIQHLQLFHGDLHHYNILSSGDKEWKIIDPKGLISEPTYEIAPFLMNCLKGKDIIQTIKRRVEIFTNELDIPAERLLKWAAVQSVISLWWIIEDGLPVKPHHINVAGAFYRLSKECSGG